VQSLLFEGEEMIKFIQEVMKRYKGYVDLQADAVILIDRNNKLMEENKELSKQISELVDQQEENLPSVDNSDYWDQKYPQAQIFYAAPIRKLVTSYVEPRQVKSITLLADAFINTHTFIDADEVPLAVMRWLNENFLRKNFKYKLDKGETWELPEVTITDGYGDCDSWGIVEYYLIREILTKLGWWESTQHRLKCQVIHVHELGQNYPYAGVHFNLLWLHSDGQFYTVESTFNLGKAIANFSTLPQKYNPQYGLICWTFNEYGMWSQNSIDASRLDFKKVKR